MVIYICDIFLFENSEVMMDAKSTIKVDLDNPEQLTIYNITGVPSDIVNDAEGDGVYTAGKVFIGIATAIIVFGAIIGNSLVIASVYKFHRLRVLTNYFIVSLAFADLLVAALVMPFSASGVILDKWIFDASNSTLVCDIFNANDVLFSTASLLHLCCISMDRYIAIIHPLHYDSTMTKARVAIMLTATWVISFLISYIPIHTHLYTPEEKYSKVLANSEICDFHVTRVYAAISSTVSFWIPSIIMVIAYLKIFKEARKQEKRIHAQGTITSLHPRPSIDHDSNSDVSATLANGNANGGQDGDNNNSSDSSRRSSSVTQNGYTAQKHGGYKHSESHNSRRKMKREHKAAKTLGIIMGAFLLSWLPFFLWYTITNVICDGTCDAPPELVTVLFWIGYFNSSINPVIYAYFNREFRNAFKKLLHVQKCCANSLHSSPAYTSNGSSINFNMVRRKTSRSASTSAVHRLSVP